VRFRRLRSTTTGPTCFELGVDGPPICLVAETDRPVRYALVVGGDDVAYVAELAVAPAEQGQGTGPTSWTRCSIGSGRRGSKRSG